jgi:F0F1-type ATP synthase delta subunit
VAGAFVRLLAKRGELARVRDVIRRLTVTVTAESSRPLSPALRKAIESASGSPVIETTSKDLIGGLRLRIGDRVLDGSDAGQLERLKRTLSE